MTLSTSFTHSPNGNGNGNGRGYSTVHERGLAHLRLTREERVRLAADVATDKVKFVPSMAHLANAFDITSVELREELRRRAEAAGQDIVNAWNAASFFEREMAVRTIGIDDVWDAIASAIA
jgi:hypothetical protein